MSKSSRSRLLGVMAFAVIGSGCVVDTPDNEKIINWTPLTLTFQGRGMAGATVDVYAKSQILSQELIGSTTVLPSGNWWVFVQVPQHAIYWWHEGPVETPDHVAKLEVHHTEPVFGELVIGSNEDNENKEFRVVCLYEDCTFGF